MFEFKKTMQGVNKEEGFECDCCGSIGVKDSNSSSGCKSSCGTAAASCCGPVESSCGAPMNSFCGGNQSPEPAKQEESGCKSSCSKE